MVAPVIGQAAQASSYQSLEINVDVRAAVARRNGDTISLTTLDYSASLKIVGENVLGRLQSALDEAGPGDISTYDPTDFTPEAVSPRIPNFPPGRLDLATNEEETNSVLGGIERGINQGLAQARETLAALDVLNGRVAEGVDQTESLLRLGFDRLTQSVQELLAQSDVSEVVTENAAEDAAAA